MYALMLSFVDQLAGLELAGFNAMAVAAGVMIGGSVVVAWWGLTGAQAGKAADHLKSTQSVDLHELLLTRSAEERVVTPFVAALAKRVRAVSPSGLIAGVERKVALAGAPPSWPVERVLAFKLIMGAIGISLAIVLLISGLTTTNIVLACISLYTGYQGPDLMLVRNGSIRQEEIRRTLADAIDQVTISVEAGLGFDAAINRYADTGSGPLAEELSRLLQDLQLGLSRRDAFDGLLARTDVDDLRRFVLALRQADEHGIPLAQVLRTQAAELRDRRRQRAETRAAAIPVKVIFPMILCILPTLFIVILGPAVFRIADTFSG